MDSAGNPIQNNNAIKFLKNLTGFSLSTWVGFIISFISVPFTTRLFMPDQVGVINMFGTVSALFSVLLTMGLDLGYARFFHENINGNKPQHLLAIILSIITATTVLVSTIALIFFPIEISNAIAGTYIPIIPWLLFLNVLASVFLKFLNLNNRMHNNILAFTIQSILIILTTKILYLVAAVWKPVYLNAIILIVVGTVGIAIIYFLKQRREFTSEKSVLDKGTIKTLLLFSLPLMPSIALMWLNSSMASLMLRNFTGFETLGIYTSAVGVASIIGLLQAGFNTFWVSYVYANYKTEQNKIKRIHDYLTFSMVLFAILIILSQDFIFLIIGKNYVSSKLFFSFLLIYPVCYTISETTGLGISISRKTHLSIIPAAANVCVNALICLITIPILGAVGAAIASGAAGLAMIIVRTIVGEKYYKCVNNYARTGGALLIIILAATANYVFFSYDLVKYLSIFMLLVTLIIIYFHDARYLVGVVIDIIRKLMTRIPKINKG